MNNITEIKKICIKSFLEARGIRPVVNKGYYGLYHSPVREDASPSFKVDFERNLWVDYGTGDGGSIIDLTMALERCDKRTAIKLLDGDVNLIRVPEFDHTRPLRSELTIIEIKPLEHPSLLNYLKNRGIEEVIAKHTCKEVHYQIKDKAYFAIGFQNDLGGWELRNPYFKGSTSPKDISTRIGKGEYDKVIVFEGFIDYMSYLALCGKIPEADFIILNSVANVRKAISHLKKYSRVMLMLDNDDAGRQAAGQIAQLLPDESNVTDYSSYYASYKDANECLQSKLKR